MNNPNYSDTIIKRSQEKFSLMKERMLGSIYTRFTATGKDNEPFELAKLNIAFALFEAKIITLTKQK